MKIFAKRSKKRSSIGDGDDKHESSPSHVKKEETKKEEEVISYFSSKFESTIRNSQNKLQKKKKNEPVEHDIEALLAMNPDDMNSKQRRVLRRHQQRQNESKESADVTAATISNNKSMDSAKQQTASAKIEKKSPDEIDREKENNDTHVFEKKDDNDNVQEATNDLRINKDDESSSSSCSETKSIDEIFENDDKKKQTPKIPIIEGEKKHEEVERTEEKKNDSNDKLIETNEMKDGKIEIECTEEGKPISSEIKSADTTKEKVASSIVAQLRGLNSKERRKLLRKLKAETGVTQEELAMAEGEARRVADKNRDIEKKETAKLKINKRKHNEVETELLKNSSEFLLKSESSHEAKSNDIGGTEEATPKKKKKKSKVKDWSHLPEEERKRREQQREKQAEAARLRSLGEITPGRHPLNSERRRANRRKPGRAGKIAKFVKEQKEGKRKSGNFLGEFDANGYQRRKEKRHGKDNARANNN